MWRSLRHRVARELDERLRRYAADELPRRLGGGSAWGGQATVRRFARGSASHLRYVEAAGGGKVVLRASFRRGHFRRLAGYPRLHEVLTSGGIPVPRLLFVDDSRATLRKYGFSVLAEEFLDGQSVADLPPEARAAPMLALADVLARLHAIRGPAAGTPWEGDPAALGRLEHAEAALWLERVRLLDFGVSRRRSRRLAAWFVEQFRSLGRAEFPLTHGDPHGANLVLASDGKVYLLDFALAKHWFPQVDLVIATYWLERYAPGRGGEFLARYFAASAPDPALTAAHYGATRPLFLAWFFLHMASSRCRRARKQKDAQEPGWEPLAAEARELWDRMEALIREAGAS